MTAAATEIPFLDVADPAFSIRSDAVRVDLRRDAARLHVPVYLMQGRHELEARTALVPKWLDVPRSASTGSRRQGMPAHWKSSGGSAGS